MHDARAVANYFIDRALAENRPLTIMTLLKVMYFSHAWHLAIYKEPLVGQPFEAWQHGPVNRVVYDQFKKLGSKPITNKALSFSIERRDFIETPYQFEKETETFLFEMFEYYSKFHAFKLSDLTHEKGSPWDQIWNETSKGSSPGMVIPNDLIRSWFTDHAALYWSGRIRETPS